MTTKKNREHDRHPVDVPVGFFVQGRFYNGLLKNISKSGVFIETNKTFSIGQDISLNFGKQKMIGIIVRVEPHGIRVKFKKSII